MLSQPFIKKIIQLLRYINTEQEVPFSGDDLLFEILHFDFFKVPPFEIAKLAVAANRSKYSKAPSSIRKLLIESANAPAKDLFDTGIDRNLRAVSNILEKLIDDTATVCPLQIFENVILDAQVQFYVNQSSDRPYLTRLLEALSDFIIIETNRNPGLQLNEMMAVMDTLERNSLPIPVTYISGSWDAISIIQISDSDLKEYSYVFIIGANEPIPLKPDWPNAINKFTGTAQHTFSGSICEWNDSELIQILNAKLPGNKSKVLISYSKKNYAGKAIEPAKFLSTLVSDYDLPVNHLSSNSGNTSNGEVLQETGLLPEIAQPEETFIAPILKKFVMNVSALNKYLDCPLGFYFETLLRVPAGKNEAMEFGSAIHFALENLFRKMSTGHLVPTDFSDPKIKQYHFSQAAEMVEDFNNFMLSHRSHFTQEAFERRIQYGRDVLQNHYNEYINSWNKIVSVERNISGVTINGVPIKGKLDKLEFNGNEVTIVDYKSGDIEKARSKMKPPQEDLPNGGDYWRQAVFYSILVDNYDQKDWKVGSLVFDFVEPDQNKAFQKEKILINASDIERVKQQITDVWKKIQSRQFYTGCGKHNCFWCNFVKENKLAVAMHQKEIHPENH
jgi:DNA helicase-2/ATP-dependent DNA helicase PcrA